MADFDQIKYISEYNKQHYDSITIRLPAGSKSEIKEKAAARGLSVAAYLWKLVQEDIIHE